MNVRKIAVFVDVQNIYYTTRDTFKRQFYYQKLWQLIAEKGEIVTAIAYATDRGDDKQIKFQSTLKKLGLL